MNIVVTGVKASGKSTVGPLLAQSLGLPFIDVDDLVVEKGRAIMEDATSCADIYRALGDLEFRRLEVDAVREVIGTESCVLATGGSTMLTPTVRELLADRGDWVFLDADSGILWKRVARGSLPSYLEQHPAPETAFSRRAELIRETIMSLCSCVVDVKNRQPEEIVVDILNALKRRELKRSEAFKTIV